MQKIFDFKILSNVVNEMEEYSDEHDGTDGQQDVEQLKELKPLDDSILAIVANIKNDRNRACIQNIHTFRNRRGINIEGEKLRKVIENFIFRNVIVDKGREGKESFFAEVLSSDCDEIVDKTKRDSETNTILTPLTNSLMINFTQHSLIKLNPR